MDPINKREDTVPKSEQNLSGVVTPTTNIGASRNIPDKEETIREQQLASNEKDLAESKTSEEKKEKKSPTTQKVDKDEVVAEHMTKFERFLGISLAEKEKHLLTATKDFSNIKNTINVTEGVFGIKLKQPIHLRSGDYIRNITNEATSNFSCMNVSKEIAFTRPNQFNFVGCNRQLLNEDGTLNTAAVISDLTRNFPDKFFIPKAVSEFTYQYSLEDSHTFYIYNMLTSWLYTILYESNSDSNTIDKDGNKFMCIKLRRPYYEDSHCIINYGVLSEEKYINIEYCQAFIKTDTGGLIPNVLKRNKDNYFNNNYVLRIPSNITKEQYSFYIAHLYRREPAHDYVNFDLGFYPRIANIAIDQAGTFSSQTDTNIGDHKTTCTRIYPASQLLSWIIEYVSINNLFYDLALATELIFRAAFWPVPETQEGAVWLQRGYMKIAMPEFKPIRGLYPNLFMGEPYVPPGIVKFFYTDKNQIINQLLYGALENYIMIYALQVQVYVRTHHCHAWYAACQQYNEKRQITNAWDLYEVLFKVVYKVDFITNMNPHGYVTFVFNYDLFEGVVRVSPKEDRDSKMNKINSKRFALASTMVAEYGEPNTFKGLRDNMIVTRNDFNTFIKYKIYPDEVTKYIKDVEKFKQVRLSDKDMIDKYYNEYANRIAQFTDNTRFLITTLPAWVSGAMLDGSIDLPSAYCSGIRPTWTYVGQGNKDWNDVQLDKREALSFTQALRYFNKDIKLTDKYDLKQLPIVIKPWANVHQRIIEPSSLLYIMRSNHLYYYGDITQPARAITRFDRDPWSLIEGGYTINKSRGSYYSCEFLSTRVVTKSRIVPVSYDPQELELMASFQSAHSLGTKRIGFENKEIEEEESGHYFHRPGAIRTDPASLLPGETLSEEAVSTEIKKA